MWGIVAKFIRGTNFRHQMYIRRRFICLIGTNRLAKNSLFREIM